MLNHYYSSLEVLLGLKNEPKLRGTKSWGLHTPTQATHTAAQPHCQVMNFSSTKKKRQFSDTHIFTSKKIQYTHGLSSKIRMVQITSILCYIIQSCQKSIIGHMVWMQVQQLRMHCHHMSATAENRVLIGVYCWVEERANQHHLCLIVGDAVTAKRRRRNLHKKETQACMENGQMHSPIFACLLALGIHWPLILKSPSF